jgi:hypothetical protein
MSRLGQLRRLIRLARRSRAPIKTMTWIVHATAITWWPPGAVPMTNATTNPMSKPENASAPTTGRPLKAPI